MAQCFVSTYRNHFRWQQPTLKTNWKPNDSKFPIAIPFQDMRNENEKAEPSLTKEIDEWLQSCYKNRMKSIYQRDYSKRSEQDLEKELIDNELLEYCKNLYEPESRSKIASPLAGSRKGNSRKSKNVPNA